MKKIKLEVTMEVPEAYSSAEVVEDTTECLEELNLVEATNVEVREI